MKLHLTIAFLLGLVLLAPTVLCASDEIGLPVVFVHGFCGAAEDWEPVVGNVRSYLQSQYPNLYSNSATEYYAYYDVVTSRVWFQFPNSRYRTWKVDPRSRFFLVALKDPSQSLYEDFDPTSVAQVPIYAKGNELANIIWAIKASTGAPRVMVIAHSMGGLDVRAYIERLASPSGSSHNRIGYYDDIVLLDTLDTPHGGTDLAGIDLRRLPACWAQASTNKTEMTPNGVGSIMPQMDYFATGASPLPFGLTIASIVSYWNLEQTDDILSRTTQDLASNLNDPGRNSESTLLSIPNEFDHIFGRGFHDGCGWPLFWNPLHIVYCTGRAAQTLTRLEQTMQVVSPAMYQGVQIVPGMSYIHLQTSIQLTATTLSGGPAIWSILEGANGGNITPTGLYEAPGIPGRYHAIAIDSLHPDQYGEATISVSAALGSGYANTLLATNIGNNSVVLNGDANLAGIPGYVNFLFSTDPNMKDAGATANQYLPVDSQTHSFVQPLSGLQQNTNYYYQAALYATDGTLRSQGNISGFLTTSGGQPIWPMSGHDQKRSGLAQFTGPQSFSGPPTWTFLTTSPIVGDLSVSTEGNIYFGSDQLYALKPDGTPYADPVPLTGIATSPAIDEAAGNVYVATNASDHGFDILRYTKQLTNRTTVFHVPPNYYGGGISTLIIAPNGTIYFLTGRYPGTLYSVGVSNWSNSICPSETGTGSVPNGPVLGADGSVYAMCQGVESGASGLYKLDPVTGSVLAYYGYSRGATEPMIDSTGRVYAGYQAFGGAQYVGSYDLWDSNLNHLRGNSGDYTTSRASLFQDGSSTVRMGYADANYVYLVAEGAYVWQIISDGLTTPFFTSVPTVDASGTVFVGNATGVKALSQVDGSIIWSATTGDGITTQPVVAGSGTLYVGSSSGKVYAFIH
jgi:pimeloyl-ACP methyl ester carboxylesterase